MMQYYHMVNDWMVATGIPWWVWMVVGILVMMFLMAGVDVFVGMVLFIFCFIYLPYVVVVDTGETLLGVILGLLIGLFVWIFCLAIGDKFAESNRRIHR